MNRNIQNTENKIKLLQLNLQTYKNKLNTLEANHESYKNQVMLLNDTVRGLTLRSINKNLLMKVFSFLSINENSRGILIVCKFWLRLFEEMKQNKEIYYEKQSIATISTIDPNSSINSTESFRSKSKRSPAAPLTEALFRARTQPIGE